MDAILRESVWNNAPHRITGALGRMGSHYVQVLEGPTPALDVLLSRLESDARHSGLTILAREPDPFRLFFPGWSMARNSDDAGLLIQLLTDIYRKGQTVVA